MPKWLFIFSFAVLTACSSVQPTDPTAGMIQLNPNIHVDPAMSTSRRQQLLIDISRSKQRISSFFGSEMQSTPTIYACVTSKCLQKFSNVYPGMEGKAVGKSTIVLAEAGCNETIITHEMTHIELHQRLGKNINLNHIPMWFDEGLAILACQDSRYTQDTNLPSYNVDRTLKTGSQWMSAIRNYQKPYQRSYQAVREWHASAGTQGLLQTIEHMKQTGRFSLVPNGKSTFSKKIASH